MDRPRLLPRPPAARANPHGSRAVFGQPNGRRRADGIRERVSDIGEVKCGIKTLYLVHRTQVAQRILKKQRDLLGRLGLMQKGIALLVDQQVRVSSAGNQYCPQLGRLCVRFERCLASLVVEGGWHS